MPIPIAIPIRPQIVTEGIRLTQKVAEHGGDFAELWCDQLNIKDAIQIVKASEVPLIITLKDENDRGLYQGSHIEFKKYLTELSMYEKVSYVDVKMDYLDEEISKNCKKPIIASYHNFYGTDALPDLIEYFEKMGKYNPAVIKLATQIKHEIDVINLFQLQLRTPAWRKKRIVIGMGDKGIATRVMAPLFEHTLTFAALSSKTITAPGQITIDQLRKEWETLKFD